MDSITKIDAFWGVLLLTGAIYELVAIRRRKWKATLSQTTRRWFFTDTVIGRWVFGVAWVGFSGWYLWHILWQ